MNYPANGVVYGGIIQRIRGAVGTFGSGGIGSGYEEDYNYDPRLMDTPPPGSSFIVLRFFRFSRFSILTLPFARCNVD